MYLNYMISWNENKQLLWDIINEILKEKQIKLDINLVNRNFIYILNRFFSIKHTFPNYETMNKKILFEINKFIKFELKKQRENETKKRKQESETPQETSQLPYNEIQTNNIKQNNQMLQSFQPNIQNKTIYKREDILNERKNKLEDMFNRLKNEYNKETIQKPKDIDFTDKPKNENDKNIDELLNEQMKQREYDMNYYVKKEKKKQYINKNNTNHNIKKDGKEEQQYNQDEDNEERKEKRVRFQIQEEKENDNIIHSIEDYNNSGYTLLPTTLPTTETNIQQTTITKPTATPNIIKQNLSQENINICLTYNFTLNKISIPSTLIERSIEPQQKEIYSIYENEILYMNIINNSSKINHIIECIKIYDTRERFHFLLEHSFTFKRENEYIIQLLDREKKQIKYKNKMDENIEILQDNIFLNDGTLLQNYCMLYLKETENDNENENEFIKKYNNEINNKNRNRRNINIQELSIQDMIIPILHKGYYNKNINQLQIQTEREEVTTKQFKKDINTFLIERKYYDIIKDKLDLLRVHNIMYLY